MHLLEPKDARVLLIITLRDEYVKEIFEYESFPHDVSIDPGAPFSSKNE